MTSIHFVTWGCSLNRGDSEFMKWLLKEAKFNIIDDLEKADVVILNSCVVKTPSENALYRKLKEIKEEYPHKIVIVAGCVAQTDQSKLKGYPLVGTKQIHKIVEVVEEALNENVVCSLSMEENPGLELAKVRENPVIEIVPICRGCLGNCAYCKTKAARGGLISYPIKEIKLQVRKALREGVKEIWLTAQDCGCYGFDIGVNLAKLLEELVLIESDFRIRVGMMNPNHLLKIKDELIKVFKSEKVFKFLHVPVQSGNNEILEMMGRKYTREDFVGLVKEFRKYFPELTLATDVIVGFPGESEEQYWDSLNLVREVSPEVLNISRFWERPKTKAAEMENQVLGEEIKRRSSVLTDIFNNIARMRNERWWGHEFSILIDEKNEEKGNWIGRNDAYKQVVVEGDFELGERVKVKVNKVTGWDLRGRVV